METVEFLCSFPQFNITCLFYLTLLRKEVLPFFHIVIIFFFFIFGFYLRTFSSARAFFVLFLFYFFIFSLVQGIALDPSGMSVPSYQSFLYQSSGGGSDYGQPVSPAHSPTHMMSPSQPIPTVLLLLIFQMQ